MQVKLNGGTVMDAALVNTGGNSCKADIKLPKLHLVSPEITADVHQDEESDGLVITLALPEFIDVDILIKKEDIKSLKSFMNKDAIKFMVKALM